MFATVGTRMYIKRVQLTNIRCFKKLNLNFGCPENGCKVVLLLGPNGTGKTTILRSIAIGLCDETSAAGLLSELEGENIVREGSRPAVIEVELADRDGRSFVLRTEILHEDGSTSGSPKIIKSLVPEGYRREKLFACAYGAARRPFGDNSYEKYRLIDAVYTLFRYDAALQNIEIPFYRLSYGKVDIYDLFRRFELILDLPPNSISLDSSGIRVNGPWGKPLSVGALGDGYGATLAWLSDMIGWAMLFRRDEFRGVDFPGIVLVDEVEQHLHPAWQKHIIGELHRQFGELQFIMTSHAPMCAIGAADLPDEECDLVVLTPKEGWVDGTAGHKPPRNKRADQVLTSYLFGLQTTRDNAVSERIERYTALAGKKQRSEEEDRDLQSLKIELEQTLGSPETKLQDFVEEAVHKAVDELLNSQPAYAGLDPDAIGYEIRRQIRDLVRGEGMHGED